VGKGNNTAIVLGAGTSSGMKWGRAEHVVAWGTAKAQRGVLCVEVAAAVAQSLLNVAEKGQQRKGRRTERAALKGEGGRDRRAVRETRAGQKEVVSIASMVATAATAMLEAATQKAEEKEEVEEEEEEEEEEVVVVVVVVVMVVEEEEEEDVPKVAQEKPEVQLPVGWGRSGFRRDQENQEEGVMWGEGEEGEVEMGGAAAETAAQGRE
jgi:hypothetical protein